MASRSVPLQERPPRRALLVLLLLPALAFTLSCATIENGVRITVGADGQEQYTVTQSVQLSSAYLAAARQANQDLAADYAAAGRASPGDVFPVGPVSQFVEKAAEIRAGGATVTESSTGFVAGKTEPLADLLARTAGSSQPVVQVDRTNPDETHYLLQVTIPAMDFDFASFDLMRSRGTGPKPPITTIDPDKVVDEEGLIMGFLAAVAKVAGGETFDLTQWYTVRVMLAAGLPTMLYEIELPGEIFLAEVDGKPAGTVSGGKLSLLIDEAFLRSYGTSEHLLRVESATGCQSYCRIEFNRRQPEGLTFDSGTGTYPDSCVCWCRNSDAERVACWEGDCTADCAARFDHGVWDGKSAYPECECLCETGWEMQNAVCLDCEAICKAGDARAAHDSANSSPGECACTCSGELMRYQRGTGCACVPGAVPAAGDKCICPPGFEPSARKDRCLPEEPEAATCQAGMNCVTHPDRCQCQSPLICDPWSPLTDPATGCSPRVAYILISEELTAYERVWQAMRINAMREFYRAAGYRTVTIYVSAPDDAAAALANPSTQAVAYFGHAAFPSIEGADAAGLGNRIFATLRDRYQALGLSREEAQAAASARSRALGLDYAYIDTCFSLADTSLRDYLVRSGGIYWGEENKAYSTGWRTRSVRP